MDAEGCGGLDSQVARQFLSGVQGFFTVAVQSGAGATLN